MRQTTFADSGFEIPTKKTHKQTFLEKMNFLVPWASLVGIDQASTPVAKSERPSFTIEVVLRIHFLKLWKNYSCLAMEGLYTIRWSVVGLLGWISVPPACQTNPQPCGFGISLTSFA